MFNPLVVLPILCGSTHYRVKIYVGINLLMANESDRYHKVTLWYDISVTASDPGWSGMGTKNKKKCLVQTQIGIADRGSMAMGKRAGLNVDQPTLHSDPDTCPSESQSLGDCN